MSKQCYALMNHGRIYTLQPYRDPFGKRTEFKWVGFCDGDRCGFFKTKADFERFVEYQPAPSPLGPHAEATFRAEARSTFEGTQALNMLRDRRLVRERPELAQYLGASASVQKGAGQ